MLISAKVRKTENRLTDRLEEKKYSSHFVPKEY